MGPASVFRFIELSNFRAGVFHMENYTEDSKFISFEQDE